MRISPFHDLDSSFEGDSFSYDLGSFIKSSPLKALDDSPTRTPSYRQRSRDVRMQSSPLGKRSPFASARARSMREHHHSDAVDELGELLQDLRFKERYQLVKDQAGQQQRTHSSRAVSRNSSRASTRVHTRRPSLDSTLETPSVSGSLDDSEVQEEVIKAQNEVVSRLEERLNRRLTVVEAKIHAIEEEKRRLEEERKRKEEEERKRREEEQRRLEEERKRKEEEERRKKEEEEKQRIAAEKKAQEEAEALKKKQEEDAKKAKEEAEKRAKEEAEEAAKKGKGVTNFAQVERLFVQYKQKIVDIKNDIVLKVKADLPTKNAILQHKRKINPKFGQLTSSMSQLQKIGREVTEMIKETQNMEIAYHWILNFVAKAIVSQAETEVRAKPKSSLPLAKLTVILLCEFPELKDFLMARFVKKCPLVIGYTCSVDTEEGRLRMGWKRHEDNKWEDQTTYDERMSGMMTLYSVICRLPLDQQHFGSIPQLPIGESWKMAARWMNTKPELLTNVHFTVATAWWEASGNEIQKCYGVQAKKLLQLMWTTWPESVKEKKFTGANTLMAVGEDWSREGSVKSFGEMEP